MDNKIFGHVLQTKRLSSLIIDKHPGFVFLTGPEGVGKTSCLLSLLEENGVEYSHLVANKDASQQALYSSFAGGLTIVLDEFDKMLYQVQDAFLKMVEDEYTKGFSVFAILHDEGLLTHAMRSRLRTRIPFNILPPSDFAEFVSLTGSHELFESCFAGLPALFSHALKCNDLSQVYNLVLNYCIGDDISREKIPGIIMDMDSRKDRLCVYYVCRHAIRNSLSSNISRVCAVDEFCSTILNVPSANTELHWYGFVFKNHS